MTTTEPTDTTGQPARLDGAYRGKCISWQELYRQRPDLVPDNGDAAKEEARRLH